MSKFKLVLIILIAVLLLGTFKSFGQPSGEAGDRGGAARGGMARGGRGGAEGGERGEAARGERGEAARGARGGGGGRGTEPVPETGFVQIFDGKTLNDWYGEEGRWRVEDGVIVGQTTADNPLTSNSFLVWQGGKPANFELKLEYRIFSGNSGVQYRSSLIDDIPHRLRGYQADITANVGGVGLLFGEGAGGFLAPAGTISYRSDSVSGTLGSVGEAADLQSVLSANDWNNLHIIARGNTLVQIYNGRVFSILVDDHTEMGASEGLIGFQIHVGQPMRVEFRNVRLKEF